MKNDEVINHTKKDTPFFESQIVYFSGIFSVVMKCSEIFCLHMITK